MKVLLQSEYDFHRLLWTFLKRKMILIGYENSSIGRIRFSYTVMDIPQEKNDPHRL